MRRRSFFEKGGQAVPLGTGRQSLQDRLHPCAGADGSAAAGRRERHDAARALRGQVFYFDRNDATLPAGRWYVADLIGCEVRDADTGKVYGVVTSVDHPGAQDIYTVKAPSGKEYMFPGVDAFLKERNPPEGYILVTPIPGLLDDDFDSEREEN